VTLTILDSTVDETMDREGRQDSVATAPTGVKVARFEVKQSRTDRRLDDGEVVRNVSMTNTHTTGIIGRIGAWAQRKVRGSKVLINA